MKRKFWIALLPLCGCFCVEAGAQSLSALKSELSTPDPSYGSRVEVEEHDGAASAVRSMEGRRAPEKVRGYRVRIYFDNVQHARSQAESVMARFREIYPDIPAYMDYDNIPYFKVTVGNCLTMEEAITAADNAVIYPGEGGAEGCAVYGCLFVGKGAYGVVDLSEGTEVIVKPRGSSGTADPLDQRSSVGWKGIHAAAILYDEYMVRVECGSSYSDEDKAN